MRALVLTDPEQDPQLGELDDPKAGDGQQAVTVVAAALNPVDIMQATGDDGSGLPRVVGNEAIVSYDGGLAYAERTIPPYGSIAQQALVDPSTLVAIPAGVEPATAVSVGIPGIAAWLSLEHVARMQPGETVIVLGATGAAGRVALQAAKLLGAGRVVVAGRHRETLEPLRELGADEVAVLGGDDDAAALRDAAGGDADVVFDPLFGAPLAAAIQVLRPGGRSVTIGMTAGPTAELAFHDVLGKSVLTHGNMTTSGGLKQAAYTKLIDHVAAGRIRTEVETVSLEQAENAWSRQRDGAATKLVVLP